MAKNIAKTSAEIKLDAETILRDLNIALNEDAPFSDITAKRDELRKTIALFNKQARLETFKLLRAKANPMMAAIEEMVYATMTLKEDKDKDSGLTIAYRLEAGQAYIDLLDFEKFCDGKQIASNTAWKYMIEKLNFRLALRIAKEIGDDPRIVEKRYHITSEAMGIDLADNPTSNTKLLKALQGIVDAILYEDNDGKNKYRATSHDVQFLLNTLTGAGKEAHGVRYANVSTARNLVMRIMNRIITDSTYRLEYKSKLDAAKEAENGEADKAENEKEVA